MTSMNTRIAAKVSAETDPAVRRLRVCRESIAGAKKNLRQRGGLESYQRSCYCQLTLR